MSRYRTFLATVLAIGVIYILITPAMFLFSKQGVSALSVRVDGVPHDEMSVMLVSAKTGSKYYASYEEGEGFCQRNSYIPKFDIVVPKERLKDIKSVEIKIGETVHSFQGDDVSQKFKANGSDTENFTLQSSELVSPTGSVVPMLRECITWKGDVTFVLNAWTAYLPSLIVIIFCLVLIFVPWPFPSEWIEYNSAKIVSVAFLVMLFISFFYVGRICNTIDDFTITNEVRFGEFTMCMSNSLGLVLSALHKHISSSVAWYGWMLYCVNIVALLVILLTIFKYIENRLVCLTIGLLMIGMFPYLLTEITFTISAILISGAPLFAITCALLRGFPRYSKVVGLGCLFALGCLIRMKTIMAVGLFICPILFYIILRAGRLKNVRVWCCGVLFLVPLFLAVALETFVIPKFHSKQHEDFYVHAEACVPPHDFEMVRGGSNLDALLQKNDWSLNDYDMFLIEFMYFDEDKYSLDKIQNIQEMMHFSPFGKSFKTMLKDAFFVLQSEWTIFVPSVLLAIILRARKVKYFELFGVIAFFFACSLIMKFFFKFPIRLYYPLGLFSLLLGCFLLVVDEGKIELSRQRSVALFLVGVVFFAQGVVQGMSRRADVAFKKHELNQSVIDVMKICSDGVATAQPHAFDLWKYDPLFPSKEVAVIMDDIQIAGGWRIFSPVFYRKLKSIGLSSGHELFVSLYKNPKFYFFCNNEKSGKLLKYLQENYDSRVEIVKSYYVSPGRSVFQYAVAD